MVNLRSLALGATLCMAALSGVVGAIPAQAARVTPMVTEITPEGTRSVVRLEVTNDEDRDVPFELTMHRGTISETGEVSLVPADERFVVFPPQTVIAANSQQVFRIQFLPAPDVTTSEIYYASISQIPVELEPTDSRIQLLMRFNVLVNLVPSGTQADPVVDYIRFVERERPAGAEAEAAETAANIVERGLEVRVSNNGTRYFGAGETGWTIAGRDVSGDTFTEILDERQVRENTGLGIVAPGKSRVFFIPMDRDLDPESLSVSFFQ